MIFTSGQQAADGKLSLPHFLRAALGIHNEAVLNIVPLANGPGPISEFIASDVPSPSWHDIWRLEATFIDRPGIIKSLASLLKRHCIKILRTRCTVANHFEFLRVDMHLDLTCYSSDYDGTTQSRKENPMIPLAELKARIGAEFALDLDFLAPGQPLLYIRRNQTLLRASHSIGAATTVPITRGLLHMPQNFSLLRGTQYASQQAMDSSAWYLVADADQMILHIYRALPRTPVIHVRFNCDDSVGTLALLASEFWRKRFNILQCYLRPQGQHNRSMIDFLLQLKPSQAVRSRPPQDLKEVMFRIATKLEKRLKCKVSFPRPRRARPERWHQRAETLWGGEAK